MSAEAYEAEEVLHTSNDAEALHASHFVSARLMRLRTCYTLPMTL